MDDDLNSLRGDSPSSDDDFFSSFESSSAETMTSGPAATGSGSLDLFDSPAAAAPAPAKKGKAKAPPKKKKAKRRSSGLVLGMTPQQRMILSIFLFLDVAVLGCLILIALQKIQL